jgi:hypothetical protein
MPLLNAKKTVILPSMLTSKPTEKKIKINNGRENKNEQ